MGWISESKYCKRQWYGWYCNSARQQKVEPLSYNDWGKERLS